MCSRWCPCSTECRMCNIWHAHRFVSRYTCLSVQSRFAGRPTAAHLSRLMSMCTKAAMHADLIIPDELRVGSLEMQQTSADLPCHMLTLFSSGAAEVGASPRGVRASARPFSMEDKTGNSGQQSPQASCMWRESKGRNSAQCRHRLEMMHMGDGRLPVGIYAKYLCSPSTGTLASFRNKILNLYDSVPNIMVILPHL